MILHILPDDKFSDAAVALFEQAAPLNHRFYVITKKTRFAHITSNSVKPISPKLARSRKFKLKLTSYDFVVIHFMDKGKRKLVNRAPLSVKFLWIGWGADYYSYIDQPQLQPKTKFLFEQQRHKKSSLLTSLRAYYKKYNRQRSFVQMLKRVNYFAPVLQEDYALIQEHYPCLRAKYLDWNYSFSKDLLHNQPPSLGNNILLGNSATYSNNHIEAIDKLASLQLLRRKVVVPLSYGEEKYKNHILDYAESALTENFAPLTDFMPLTEYQDVLATCSVVIMNHLRQQGLGNILIMLFYGAKIFLNPSNTIYKYLKQNGVVVFSTDGINQKELDSLLTPEQTFHNQQWILQRWSNAALVDKTRQVINAINSQ